jgi:hypothetical protein
MALRPSAPWLHTVRFLAIGSIASCLLLPARMNAEEIWSGFQNGGQLQVEQLPESWDASGKGIAWKAALEGYGQSTPVVAEQGNLPRHGLQPCRRIKAMAERFFQSFP